MRSVLLPLAAVALLGACEPRYGGPVDREAGLPGPGFGLAVANNEIVARGGSPIVSLQSRFAGDAPSIVTFPFDGVALDATARWALDRQAVWMLRHPDVRFSVHGHADEPGATPYNEALGRRRAEVVVAYLALRGVGRHRLDAVASFGERRPLVPGMGRERLNRRAVTVVSQTTARRPAPLDGRYAERVYDGYVASGGATQSDPVASGAATP